VKRTLKVGVISDTHGFLRPEALAALCTVDHIIHAGDIGSPSVLDELCSLAPVTAVRGNIDTEEWARRLPATAVVELGGLVLYVIHAVHELDLDPRAAGFTAVISGHSHQPAEEWRNGVLYFNPGSAGHRRFRLPIAMGFLTICRKKISSEIVLLTV
jgi:hypothetical protein